MKNINLGDRYRFVPSAFAGEKPESWGKKDYTTEITGRVIYINRANRYFTVAADINGYTLRESFKLY